MYTRTVFISVPSTKIMVLYLFNGTDFWDKIFLQQCIFVKKIQLKFEVSSSMISDVIIKNVSLSPVFRGRIRRYTNSISKTRRNSGMKLSEMEGVFKRNMRAKFYLSRLILS